MSTSGKPVAHCWSLRRQADGLWQLDGGGGGGPAPDPFPVTTIAWRLGHLGGRTLGGFADRRFGHNSQAVGRIDYRAHIGALPEFLDAHFRAWRSGLSGLTQTAWKATLGPSWGPYAEADTVDLALHVLDEVIHHSTEVGVLRDLYPPRPLASP